VTALEQGAFESNRSLWIRELSLSPPSMLAFQALAKDHLRQAKALPPGAARDAELAEAEAVIARGEAHYRALERVPADGYYTTHLEYYAKLFYLRGQIAELEGEDPAVQLGHYQRSAELKPDSKLTSMMLAKTTFKMANQARGEERLDLARRSLRHFLEFAAATRTDPRQHAQNLAMLDANYARAFPELAPEIEAARERWR
jgi:hypothetical protein